MPWSAEEIISFITMLFTIPTFILALWGLLRCHQRSQHRRPGSESSTNKFTIFRINETPLSSVFAPSSPVYVPPDLESGWIQFSHITTSSKCTTPHRPVPNDQPDKQYLAQVLSGLTSGHGVRGDIERCSW
ncbi:hypothetical protein BDW75DRAFT_19945 [Aspergillus navahoensis]